MAPDALGSWSTWLLVVGAITPDDPQGLQAAGDIVLNPAITLNGDQADITFDGTAARNVVTCASDDAIAGAASFIAIDPARALVDGCKATGGESTSASICINQYPDQSSDTVDEVTTYTRDGSLYQVCSGSFGVPPGLTMNSTLQCAIIGIAAHKGPVAEVADSLCNTSEIVNNFNGGGWIGAAKGVGCQLLGGIIAEAGGIAAAGLTSEAVGPGAVAIGVNTFRALEASVPIICDGLLNGITSPTKLGAQLEANHEAQVATKVVADGKCLRYDKRGLLHAGVFPWSATNCP